MIGACKIWKFIDVVMTNVSDMRVCIREREWGGKGVVNMIRTTKMLNFSNNIKRILKLFIP